jgi:phosphatidylserine/phosphatidylglycerophosphate/cardiolipin synthase-like enzyme
MNDAFTKLSDTDLQTVIAALRSGRLSSPYTGLQVARVVPAAISAFVRTAFLELEAAGFSGDQIATVLSLIEADRMRGRTTALPIDLVTSGPEAPGVTNRDTSVVVRELFAHARKSVLVVGYAVYQGQQVFQSLARRMEAVPDLDVKFYLNIARPDADSTPSEILVSKFKQRFKDKQWPLGYRLPEMYFDPRSLADGQSPTRSSLHAKCIVVDSSQVFVSSANFTEAAHERNIEVGLKIESEWLARGITAHFQHLHDHGLLTRAF